MSSLRDYGTIAFDPRHIRRLIGMGGLACDERTGEVRIVRELDPTQLQLGLWLATVPDVYRSAAERAARRVCEPLLMQAVDDAAIDRLAYELSRECLAELDNHEQRLAKLLLSVAASPHEESE